jgi:hypothetical protein
MRWLRRSIVVLGALVLATSHALQVTVRRPGRPPASDISVTAPAKVKRIASLIDGLDTLQPGALDCTGKADDPHRHLHVPRGARDPGAGPGQADHRVEPSRRIL